jgi:hypothetical protein
MYFFVETKMAWYYFREEISRVLLEMLLGL